MPLTLQERFVAALEARGYRRVAGRSSKYITMEFSGGFLFIGRSGALRQGPSSSQSTPVSEQFKRILLESVPETRPRGGIPSLASL